MIYDKFDALMSLKPNGQYTWVGNDYANLTGSDKPSESDIDAELTRLNNIEPMRLLRVERNARLAAGLFKIVPFPEVCFSFIAPIINLV